MQGFSLGQTVRSCQVGSAEPFVAEIYSFVLPRDAAPFVVLIDGKGGTHHRAFTDISPLEKAA